MNLVNVLYSSDFRENLLSVKKMVDAGLKVTFLKSKALIQINEKVIATAINRGNLFELKLKIKRSSAYASKFDEYLLWHKRLGHIGHQGIKELENLI